jgi:hypothetical protein
VVLFPGGRHGKGREVLSLLDNECENAEGESIDDEGKVVRKGGNPICKELENANAVNSVVTGGQEGLSVVNEGRPMPSQKTNVEEAIV